MAKNKTTGTSRGQMPHPLVWYIRFHEQGSNKEVAARYFTTPGRISDIRRSKYFKHITEDAAFSKSDIGNARKRIKENFTVNSDEVTLKDAAYSLARLDEIGAGKMRKGAPDSASTADTEKADGREKVSEKLKDMGIMRDSDAPPPAALPRSGWLNMKAEFVFVALAVVFLVIFLAIFSDDDAPRQADHAATADLTQATDGGAATDGMAPGSQLPAMISPSAVTQGAARQTMSSDGGDAAVVGGAEEAQVPTASRQGEGAMSADKTDEGQLQTGDPAGSDAPRQADHAAAADLTQAADGGGSMEDAAVVGGAEEAQVPTASQQGEGAMSADQTGEDRLQAGDSADPGGSEHDSGRQPAAPEADTESTSAESMIRGAIPGSSVHASAPYAPDAAAITTLPPPQDTVGPYTSMRPPRASAYRQQYRHPRTYQAPLERQPPPRPDLQPPRPGLQPPAPYRRQGQSRTGWRW